MNKIGFGFLRLPQIGEAGINWTLLNQMVDAFLAKGGSYFDTAYTYLDGMSEAAIRKSVVKRYPRENFQVADKLPSWKLTSHQECYVYFEEQLKRCGVDFFDVYLLHWLNKANYGVCERYDEFGFLQEMKKAGKVGKIGFSYHDSAAFLEEILIAHPEVDIVQLQINYLDWDSSSIESGKCYEVAVRHGKSVVVMEPVKGGTLANLPPDAEKIFRALQKDNSMASWAIRFAQSLDRVDVVLSGMNNIEQMLDNMQDFTPLNCKEKEAIEKVRSILKQQVAVACTGCRYCVSACPKKIAIPDYFCMYNEYCRHPDESWKIQPVYDQLAKKYGRASACIMCRQCEKHCPQQLIISEQIRNVAGIFG